MSEKTILVWFRNDLRIHDNEILLEATKRADKIVPVFCFDPRYFEETPYGTRRTGAIRGKFLIESVAALRKSLEQLGGGLIVRTGLPEEVLPEICSVYDVREVYHHREVASRETDISALVEEALWKKQINLKHFIGHTLYHKEDLPFPIKNIPNDFMTFRKKVERDSVVKPCFDTPSAITVPSGMEAGELPTLAELEIEGNQLESPSEIYVGGEQEGIIRMNAFLYEATNVKNKSGVQSSSRLSPWLSLGCLSAREVYWAVKKHRGPEGASDISKIIAELQWRDYFRFMLKKHGSAMLGEIGQDAGLSLEEKKKFDKWRSGHTGVILVDACMLELNASGYISDKCRQYVASFLVKDMSVSWRAGAAVFEEKSIDYSPASSWGNWAYIVGAGIMSTNRPINIKPEDISSELAIKNRLALLQGAKCA